MKQRLLKWLFLVICSVNLTACGTIVSLMKEDYSVYGGVARDFHTMQNGGVLGAVSVIDLPLSFVLDTLMLPVTLSQ